MTENEVIKARTAFVVIQNEAGSYFAINSLDKKIETQHPASLQDIKVACTEVRDAIFRADLTNSIMSVLAPKPAPAPQESDTSAPEA